MSADNTDKLTPKLIQELRAIVGEKNLITGDDDLLVYECDAYTLEKHLPGVVVLPETTEQVIAVVQFCARNKLPVIPRGAGTSLSGPVLAVDGGVMIELTRMKKILAVD